MEPPALYASGTLCRVVSSPRRFLRKNCILYEHSGCSRWSGSQRSTPIRQKECPSHFLRNGALKKKLRRVSRPAVQRPARSQISTAVSCEAARPAGSTAVATRSADGESAHSFADPEGLWSTQHQQNQPQYEYSNTLLCPEQLLYAALPTLKHLLHRSVILHTSSFKERIERPDHESINSTLLP